MPKNVDKTKEGAELEPRYRSDQEIQLDFSAHALLDTQHEV
jgi:hypothetical protein